MNCKEQQIDREANRLIDWLLRRIAVQACTSKIVWLIHKELYSVLILKSKTLTKNIERRISNRVWDQRPRKNEIKSDFLAFFWTFWVECQHPLPQDFSRNLRFKREVWGVGESRMLFFWIIWDWLIFLSWLSLGRAPYWAASIFGMKARGPFSESKFALRFVIWIQKEVKLGKSTDQRKPLL